MSQNSRNPNPVAFLSDTRQLSHNREAAFGTRRPHACPLGYVPPFQIVRRLTDSNLNTIKLFKVIDGSSTTITVDMYSTGFEVLAFADYKIWSYPGTVPILVSGFDEPGTYYMTISDMAGNVLTRQDFQWMQEASMTGFVKVEWFHQRNFTLPFGHINFVAPFKFWHWFDTELGKPSYQYERDVDERNGFEYVNKVISYKEQRFVTAGDENFMDALSFLPHMDTVNVYFLGDEINAFRVFVTPTWQDRGDEALIEIEIRSDQVLETNGDALSDFTYEVEQEDCLPTELIALALIDEFSLNYTNGNYTDANGDTVSFEVGQFLLIRELSVDQFIDFYAYISPGNYLYIGLAPGLVVYESATGTYYVTNASLHVTEPVITNIDNTDPSAYIITGIGLPGTFIEIWGRVNSGSADEFLLAVGSNASFATGITFNPDIYRSFRVKCSTASCQRFAVSSWKTNLAGGGIGEGIIESTFEVG